MALDICWICNVMSTDVHWMEYCFFSNFEMRSSIGTTKIILSRMRVTSPTSPVTSRTWKPTQMMLPLWCLARCRLCRVWRILARMNLMAPARASVSAVSEWNQETLDIGVMLKRYPNILANNLSKGGLVMMWDKYIQNGYCYNMSRWGSYDHSSKCVLALL